MTHLNVLYRMFLLVPFLMEVAYCNYQSFGKESNSTKQKRLFYLLTLLPYYNPNPSINPSWTEGDNIQPALNLAVDQIKKRSDILGNYSVQLVHLSDGCDEPYISITIDSFIKEVYKTAGVELAGVIGPGCSPSTSALGSLTKKPGLQVVTLHNGVSPIFANRLQYPFHLGVLGSIESLVQGFLYLIPKANWNRFAILYDATRQDYINSKNYFLHRTAKNISLHVYQVYSTNIPLVEVLRRGLRVIFLMVPVSLANKIICIAHHLGMTSNRYQFLIMSGQPEDFSKSTAFYYNYRLYSCSIESVWKDVLNRSFIIQQNLLPTSGKSLLSNMTYMEYTRAYKEYRNKYTLETGRKSRESYWATNLYDAVWAWALVLDNLTKEDVNFEIHFGDGKTSNRIIQQFYQIHFEGMSGHMVFNSSTGFVKREVRILQVINNSTCVVAIVGQDGEMRYREPEFCIPHFVTDYVKVVRESNKLAFFFLLLTLSEFSIVIMLHIYTLAYKTIPSVKATNLQLLNISYAGVYVLILGAILWTLFSAASININLKNYFCQMLWAWTIPIGFSLSFSPVTMKMWQLYRIFVHYLDPGPFISTPYLIGGSMFVAFLNLVISVAWTLSDSYKMRDTYFFTRNQMLPSEAVEMKVQWTCTCYYQEWWLLFLAVLQIVLLLVGTVLAFLTRKIKKASFTTSSLQLLIIAMVIVCVLGFILYIISGLSIVRNQDPKSYFSFSIICILLNSIISFYIGLVFFPPLVPLVKKSRQ